ncbi:hypothetical protein VC290_19150 [Xanthomonas campestris]|uniref:hypothetical protein n=1 Tax=Xanthomonas campestris TaxID=339 RepID=UPI002B22B403|nr:hypothetical protein [Xanthomonas campestris]MEA9482428.1 hypothetical protein [Xanthomonas campestris]
MIVIRIVTRADAIRLGLSRYLTGKPCKRGHRAERRTSQGDCTECNRNTEGNPEKKKRIA